MKKDVHPDDYLKAENSELEAEFQEEASDIQLTALAVGELPERERGRVESILAGDDARRTEFEEIRSTAALLTEELKREPVPKLTDEEKQRIREAVGAAPRFPVIKQPSKTVRVVRYTAFGAIAASLAVATVTLINLDRGENSVATNESAAPLSEEQLIARERERATQRVAKLEVEIAGQRRKVNAARVAMLDMMEDLEIQDLGSGSPQRMRDEDETGSGRIVSTGYREAREKFESAKATQTALEVELARESVKASSSPLLAGGPNPDRKISRYKAPGSLSIAEGPAADPFGDPEEMAKKAAPAPAKPKARATRAKTAPAKNSESDAPFGGRELAKEEAIPRGNGASIMGMESGAGTKTPERPEPTLVAESKAATGADGAAAPHPAPAGTPAPATVSAGMAIKADHLAAAGESKDNTRRFSFGHSSDSYSGKSDRGRAGGITPAPSDPNQPVDEFYTPAAANKPVELDQVEKELNEKALGVFSTVSNNEVPNIPSAQEMAKWELEGLEEATEMMAKSENAGVTNEMIASVGGGAAEARSVGNIELATRLSGKLEALKEARGSTDGIDKDVEAIARRKQQLEDFLRRPPALDPSNEDYGKLKDNPWISAWDENFSTFSIDVDTASYSNVRRFVANRNQLPPKDAVRIEEMINYFDYEYPQPEGEHPFAVTTEVASCPWAPDHRLLRIGLKGKEMFAHERPPMNLVFLIDVSGSMEPQNKLPLLKTCIKHLVDELSPRDRIAMVVYAGKAGLVLDATSGDRKDEIKGAIERLQSGGSTAGGAGIQLAYKVAKENHIENGVNRVILATDGDFNVGDTDTGNLTTMVMNRSKSDGTFLTILGFGEGNLKESRMEQIANNGNGEYYYIDSEKEGRRVLVDKVNSTLVTIAKDVKIQIDFNPGQVGYYRLIGYANRLLHKRDFDDDRKDAGEIGAGHTVTALYEIVPAGVKLQKPHGANPTSRYLADAAGEDAGRLDPRKARKLIDSPELLTVKLRYKQPEGTKSTLLEVPLEDLGRDWAQSSEDFRFAAAVAGYGMMLRESPHRGLLNYDLVLELGVEGARQEEDPHGLRAEFIEMVKTTARLVGAR